jgi:hypothetical protein
MRWTLIEPSIATFGFHDRRRVAAKRELQRDAAAAASRQHRAPVSLLRRERQDGDRSRVDRVRLTVKKGILLRCVGQFVDETLDDEGKPTPRQKGI